MEMIQYLYKHSVSVHWLASKLINYWALRQICN